eukprot:TRINITY_DN18466_c1_g1_i1.p1 TRINITY_DN18466_c1_g1~~TRINITY_DN18466_c1_g1_i1.p1  ORF type:complete len:348 (+),score=99.89 TRINITY_DN18466_c1_g1_i1:499-1542(+)
MFGALWLPTKGSSEAAVSLAGAAKARGQDTATQRRVRRFTRRTLSHASQFVSYHPALPHFAALLSQWCGRDSVPAAPPTAAVFAELITPALDVEGYLAHLTKYSRCSPSVWPLAFEYLARLQRLTAVRVTRDTWQRLLLTSVSVAAKVADDLSYSCATYAVVGGVTASEMVCMERRFLQLLDWELFPSSQDWIADLLTDCPPPALPESVRISSPPPSPLKSSPAASSITATSCSSIGPPAVHTPGTDDGLRGDWRSPRQVAAELPLPSTPPCASPPCGRRRVRFAPAPTAIPPEPEPEPVPVPMRRPSRPHRARRPVRGGWSHRRGYSSAGQQGSGWLALVRSVLQQ